MLKTWIASAANSTSIGWSAAGSALSRPFPGAATKKSRRWSSPAAVWTSMNPPAPGPVSGDSVANDMSTAATAASTAFPPVRSTSAPAWAVCGWPAATTPLTGPMLRGRVAEDAVEAVPHQRDGHPREPEVERANPAPRAAPPARVDGEHDDLRQEEGDER